MTTPELDKLGRSGGSGLIAVIDDDSTARHALAYRLQAGSFRTVECEAKGGDVAARVRGASVACLSLGDDSRSGFRVLGDLVTQCPDISVIVISGNRDVESAIEAMRLGACDFLAKSSDSDQMMVAIRRAIARGERVRKIGAEASASDAGADAIVPLQELERRAISKALQASGGNVGKAAKLLGMGRATLYRRLAENHPRALESVTMGASTDETRTNLLEK